MSYLQKRERKMGRKGDGARKSGRKGDGAKRRWGVLRVIKKSLKRSLASPSLKGHPMLIWDLIPDSIWTKHRAGKWNDGAMGRKGARAIGRRRD